MSEAISDMVDALNFNTRIVLAATGTLAIAFASPASAGTIYRCTGTDGSIEFSNLACPPDTAITAFTVKANFVDVSDSRYRGRPERTQDESAGMASPGYVGAAWDNGRRNQADLLSPINSAREVLAAGGPTSAASPSLAGHIREAREAEAQRRTQRAADRADRKQ